MKKKSLLFLLFGVIVIVVLALLLVFGNFIDKNKNSNTNENLVTSTNNKAEITFDLAYENPIVMHVNSSIEILDSFFIVQNASIENVSFEILSYYNSDISKIKLENRKITATAVDNYKLKCTLSKDDVTIDKEVVIKVESAPKITQKQTKLNDGVKYNLVDLFEFDSNIINLNFDSNEYFKVENKSLTTLKTGDVSFNIFYIDGGVKHTYACNFSIVVAPEYQIVVEDTTKNLSEEFCVVSYRIIDRNVANIGDQQILVEVEDENVVTYLNDTAPIITFKVKGVGQTNVKIKMLNNDEIYATFVITIQN